MSAECVVTAPLRQTQAGDLSVPRAPAEWSPSSRFLASTKNLCRGQGVSIQFFFNAYRSPLISVTCPCLDRVSMNNPGSRRSRQNPEKPKLFAFRFGKNGRNVHTVRARRNFPMSNIDHYEPGSFSWAELATTDAAAAKTFYTGLFGWSYVDSPAGPDMIYTRVKKGGKDAAALYQLGKEQK